MLGRFWAAHRLHRRRRLPVLLGSPRQAHEHEVLLFLVVLQAILLGLQAGGAVTSLDSWTPSTIVRAPLGCGRSTPGGTPWITWRSNSSAER